MSEPRDDTTHLVAAIVVMQRLEGRLDALDARLEALHEVHAESSECNKTNRIWGVIFDVVKTALTFSGQISVVLSSWFIAGYVWVSKKPYVQGILEWISSHHLWPF